MNKIKPVPTIAQLKEINLDGFKYFATDTIKGKVLHSFSKEIKRGSYAEIKCYDSEVLDGSLALLIKHGMTR